MEIATPGLSYPIETQSTTDMKGRPDVDSMTDRELLIEAVRGMRQVQDLAENLLPILEQAGKNPMLKMFFGGK